ncbi:hypothetical protein SAMN04488058_12132 [Deinococcus reticulitermitis]|uniref:Uncharacterized protein n=1 Tax=Deinococcus reticulitermitis TaxID=856736 RepID=A0A1H7BZU3_9DEIO|nr:hypothetical protein [Deinococcus reticulitermitis]SEJ83173.1 hypothetical protein SAMN04488058_12132 [Deinococcus reticulitermitis]
MTRPPTHDEDSAAEEEIFEATTLPAAQVGVKFAPRWLAWLALAGLAGLWLLLWPSGWGAWWQAGDWGRLTLALAALLALLWGTAALLRRGLTGPGLLTLGALSLALSAPRLAELDALMLLLGPLALGAALWWSRGRPQEDETDPPRP